MTDSDDNLKAALAENGAFERDKAAETGQTAVNAFRTTMKKVERRTWFWGIFCKCVAIFAVMQFIHSTDTKEMLLNIFVAIFLLEVLMMYKLWYWLLNSKLSLLKEIKQLRAETPGASEPTEVTGLKSLVDKPVQGLSSWERRLWFLAYMVCVLLVILVKLHDIEAIAAYNEMLALDGYVTLDADGTGTAVTQTSSPNREDVPVMSFPFNAPSGATVRWVDHHGRELPVTVSTEDSRDQYTVSFADPVLPGERLTYKRISETPGLAAKDGDTWTYHADRGSRPHSHRYNETVMLPVGAEFVSAEPEPSQRFISSAGRLVVQYRNDYEPDERFSYKIQYQLPSEPSR